MIDNEQLDNDLLNFMKNKNYIDINNTNNQNNTKP